MITLALFSFVGLIALSLGSKCCSPPQWERGEHIEGTEFVNGTMSPFQGTARTAYDAKNHKFMTKFTMMRGKELEKKHILNDYSTGMKYVVTNGKCMKTELSGPFPEDCVPDEASGGFPMYFGVGDNKIKVTNYILTSPNRSTSLLVTENCVPFSNSTTSTEGESPFSVAIGYNGTTLGISDPSVFDIPPACSHDDHTVTGETAKTNFPVCCFPKQIESPGGSMGLVNVNGKALMQQGVQYTIQNDVCRKSPLTTPMAPDCTPADATFKPVLLGTGNSTLKGRMYNYIAEGVNMTIFATEDCIPFSETLYGHAGPYGMDYWMTMGFSALTIGIKDPSVFDVPASCRKLTTSY
ncbi:ependymin-related protein 1-like [Ylistrum balloti]|uniref:ependymin-related protein 1-like n=1 Tax=Ylistrum balloti TaxID=509963 RepID=UPI002905D0BD|nr:ependymin-related protein 1-like [Ylistrum balloti]